MSADNSICILESNGNDGKPEFRVAHVQNVEMADYHDVKARNVYLRDYFAECKVYRSQGKAFKYAMHLLSREMYVEYGIVPVKIGGKFPGLAGSSSAPASGAPVKPISKKSEKKRRPSRLERRVNSLTRRLEQVEALLCLRK